MLKLIDAVDTIIDQYPKEKGLIHTHTYKILHALTNNSRHKHRFRFHDSGNREEVLGDFLRSPDPDILVSPSMVEGIDLKDDLGRFQILCKVPWPYLGDPQIAALREKRDGWYLWKTSLDIVQACGRIMRHDNDWGDTYVIDPDFRRWLRSARDILPEYFTKAIKFVKEW
jgi:Rad3-related DNA helicase